jgi:thiamine-phosphate pyrophosphorylase
LKKDELKHIDFYMVTDSLLSRRGTLSDVEQAIKAGCKIIQYREKSKSMREMVEEALVIKNVCRERAIFLVNDRVDLALTVDADGVHVGQEDMPFEIARHILGEDKIIGLTVHDVRESREAEEMGADYIGLSPIFETSTKSDAGRACGLPKITEVRKQVRLPIVAIGGITKENVSEVIRAGADAAVAISAVVCAGDVYKEVAEIREIICKNKTPNPEP